MRLRYFMRHLLTLVVAAGLAAPGQGEDDQPIAIETIEREEPVDFQSEILPIMRRNCLACHNSSEAESDLVLESPTAILEGGFEGPAVVAEKPDESPLLLVASRQRESYMPPDGNDVGAKPLTPQELGLIQLWIKQGAKGEVTSAASIEWQPLPPGINPIYASSVSLDGRFAAAGRANQIFLYHLPSGRELGRLTDPELQAGSTLGRPGIAHLDLIQSLTFAPSADRIASGGFRNVKIWRRNDPIRQAFVELAESDVTAIVPLASGALAVGLASGEIRLLPAELSSGEVSIQPADGMAIKSLSISPDQSTVYATSANQSLKAWRLEDRQLLANVELPGEPLALTALANGLVATSVAGQNEITIWKQADPPADGKPGMLDAERTLAGHKQPATGLAAAGQSQLVSGSSDGTLRLWNLDDGKPIRQMNHAAPVVAVAATTDGQRVASAGQDSAKIWNAADGKQLAELKGDFQRSYQQQRLTRVTALAKRRIDLATADLKAGNDRKKAEEENQKKTAEALTKAQADFKTKDEASKKIVAEKEAEEKNLAAAVEAIAKAEAEMKGADEKVAMATKTLEATKVEMEKAAVTVKQYTEAEPLAAEALTKVKQAASKTPNDKQLAEVVKLTEQALAALRQKKNKAAEGLKVLEAKIAETTKARTAADEMKKKAVAMKQEAEKARQQAEAKVKQKTEAAKKPMEERAAAERNVAASQRADDRAKAAIQKATDAIAPLEAAVKQETESHQSFEQQLAGANEQSKQPLPIVGVSFSNDGTTVSTTTADSAIRIWDAATGSQLSLFRPQNEAAAVATFAGGSRVVVGAGPAIEAWSVEPRWELERTIGSPDSTAAFVDRVTALDISPDGTVLATGSGEPSRSGQVKLWNLETGELIREINEPHSDTLFSLKFSRDGKLLASCAADRFMKVFRVEDGSFVRSFEGHTHHVLGVAWSADGRTLVSSGADMVIKIWNAATGDQKRTISGFSKEITGIEFVGDSDQIVASCGDSSVQRKRTDNGGNVRNYGGASDFVYNVVSTADGTLIIAAGQDSVLRVWNANDGKLLQSFAPPEPGE